MNYKVRGYGSSVSLIPRMPPKGSEKSLENKYKMYMLKMLYFLVFFFIFCRSTFIDVVLNFGICNYIDLFAK